MLRIVVVIQRQALWGSFTGLGPFPEYRNFRASGIPANPRKCAGRPRPEIDGGIDAERFQGGGPLPAEALVVFDYGADDSRIQKPHERRHRPGEIEQLLVLRLRPTGPMCSRSRGPPLSALSLFRIVPQRSRSAATSPEIAIEADRILQRCRALVHVSCDRDPVLGHSRPQALHQAVQFVGIVVGVEIAFMPLYSPEVADSTTDRTGFQPLLDLQPDPEWRLLHPASSSALPSIGTDRPPNGHFRFTLPSPLRSRRRRALASDSGRRPVTSSHLYPVSLRCLHELGKPSSPHLAEHPLRNFSCSRHLHPVALRAYGT